MEGGRLTRDGGLFQILNSSYFSKPFYIYPNWMIPLDIQDQGTDYMANFSPGWNFSPVSRAEVSSRSPEQIFLKKRLRLHGETFSQGWDMWKFQSGVKFRKTSCNRMKISAQAGKWAWACSVTFVFNETRLRSLTFSRNFKFQLGLKLVM